MRPGRPRAGEEPQVIGKVTFRIDAETLSALRKLEKTVDKGVRSGRRSVLLRRLILDASSKI